MNSPRSFVVLGEAPESESEEEIDVSNSTNTISVEGNIIAGEAPESDEENDRTASIDSVSSALSASSLPSLTGSNKKSQKPTKYQSLLNKKLYERNVSLHKNISDLVTTTINNAEKELNSTNQQLLKCQVQLQEASTHLRTLNVNVTQIESTLAVLANTQFIPPININKIF